MMEMDAVKKQIFEIEDFENVDAALMAKISEKEEYRALFEELKELSKTLGAVAPAPVRNGESLHGAVMKRVKEGDIAPRYINTRSFRFPVATVACLCVVLAVVLVSKSGLIQNKMRDNAMEEADLVRDNENVSYSVKEYNGDGEVRIHVVYDASDDYADQEIAEEEITIDVEESAIEEAEAAESETGSMSAPEMKKSSEALLKGDTEASKASDAALDSEVEKRLSKAAVLLDKDDVITLADIAKFGSENYISFFDSISEKDNFRELYTLENFIAFCENK